MQKLKKILSWQSQFESAFSKIKWKGLPFWSLYAPEDCVAILLKASTKLKFLFACYHFYLTLSSSHDIEWIISLFIHYCCILDSTLVVTWSAVRGRLTKISCKGLIKMLWVWHFLKHIALQISYLLLLLFCPLHLIDQYFHYQPSRPENRCSFKTRAVLF